MSTIAASLLSYLLIYKYALLIGAIAIASIIPLPINTLMLAAGAFASQGYFSATLALVSAIVANVAADVIIFLISRTYGARALRFFKIERSATIVRLEEYVRDTAGLSIFVTRFVGGLDLACTVLAGLADVSTPYFVTFDLLGNAVDYALFLFAGYFFGAYWQAISSDWGEVGSGVFLVILIAFGVSYWRYRKSA